MQRFFETLTDEHEIFVVVGGGKTARDYIGIARVLEYLKLCVTK